MKYKVIAVSWGGTEKDVITGVNYKEAFQFCESMGWTLDTGYVWDLEIVEDKAE